MIRLWYSTAPTIIAGVICCCSAAAQTTRPLEQELITQAPIFTDLTAREGLAIDGSIEWYDELRVLFRVRTVDRSPTMSMRATDDTPLLIYSEGKALVYDAPGRRMFLLHGVTMLFSFKQGEDNPEFYANIAPRTAQRPRSKAELDLQSIFSVDGATLKLEPHEDDLHLLISMPSDSLINAAAVDRSQEPPFVHYQCSVVGRDQPWVVFTRMTTNPSKEPATPSMPDLTQLAEKVRVIEYPVGTWKYGLVEELIEGWYFRLGLEDTKTRKRITEQYGRVDWNEATRADDEISRLLKELCSQAVETPEATEAP